eukprot:365221-Chlamydomonas_euryale.AAC.5
MGEAVAGTGAGAGGAGAGGGGASHTSSRQPHPVSRSAIAVRRAVAARSLTRHAAAQLVRFLARSAVLCLDMRAFEALSNPHTSLRTGLRQVPSEAN